MGQGVRETEDLAETDFVRVQRKERRGKASEGWPDLELQNGGPNWYFKVTKGPRVRLCFDCKSLLQLLYVK